MNFKDYLCHFSQFEQAGVISMYIPIKENNPSSLVELSLIRMLYILANNNVFMCTFANSTRNSFNFETATFVDARVHLDLTAQD